MVDLYCSSDVGSLCVSDTRELFYNIMEHHLNTNVTKSIVTANDIVPQIILDWLLSAVSKQWSNLEQRQKWQYLDQESRKDRIIAFIKRQLPQHYTEFYYKEQKRTFFT